MAGESDEAEVFKPYEETLSIERLRTEVREAWDLQHALIKALRDLPEMPPAWVLLHLSSAARWPEDNNIGKRLQRERRDLHIPFKSECEGGAGLWHRIREGLLASRASSETSGAL